MPIRQATAPDASALIQLFQQLYSETNFMLYEPGEAVPTPEQQAERLDYAAQTNSGATFVYEQESQIVGACFGLRGFPKSQHHSLLVVVGILQEWTGQGAGGLLLTELEKWATLHEIHRLELTVNSANHRAISLYKRLGYECEGIKRQSLKIGGSFVDELFMSKLISF